MPLPGARVRVWRAGADRGEPPLVDAVSDGQGWWRYEPDLPVGTFDLLVERFGYVARDTVPALLFGPNEWTTALRPAPRDLLQGTVSAAGSGTPLGAALEVRRPDDRVLVASLHADAVTGAYASAPLPVGSYLVVVTARGYRPRTLDLALSVGGAAADLVLEPLAGSILVVDVNLPPGADHTFVPRLDKRGVATAVGYTTQPAGSGLALVAALADLGYTPSYQPTALVDTSAWSGYDLVVLARGDHEGPLPAELRAALLARARRGGALLVEGGDLAAAQRDDPEFLADVLGAAAWAGDRGDTVDASGSVHPVAQRPAPVFTALDEAARGYADGDVLVPAADASPCALWADGRAAAVARSRDPADAAGRSVTFAFTWNRLAVSGRPRLLQNAVEWLLVPVAADARLDGRILLDRDGAPAAGAVVWLEPGGRTATADAGGGFAFTDLPAGTYRLGASQAERLGAAGVVDVTGGAAVTAPDLVLAAAVDTTLCAPDASVTIPDDAAAGVLVSLTAGDLGPVGGVRVRVDLEHPWPGDLDLELTAPDGSRVVLRRADGRADAPAAGWYAGDLRPAGDLRRLIGVEAAGAWTLRVADVAAGDQGTLTGWCLDLLVAPAPPPEVVPPPALAVLGAAPNPFNPRTTIRYAVPVAGRVTLAIHDLRGRLVRTLVDAERSAAVHEAVWDGTDGSGRAVASGAYLVRLTGARGTGSGKIMLIR